MHLYHVRLLMIEECTLIFRMHALSDLIQYCRKYVSDFFTFNKHTDSFISAEKYVGQHLQYSTCLTAYCGQLEDDSKFCDFQYNFRALKLRNFWT